MAVITFWNVGIKVGQVDIKFLCVDIRHILHGFEDGIPEDSPRGGIKALVRCVTRWQRAT